MPSPTSDSQFRQLMGPDAQARTILSPQFPSVRSGVSAPSDSGQGRARALLAGPNASGPSSARVGTGTRLASAVAHERPSVSTVDGAGRPSPLHSQPPAPVSRIRRAVTVRLGQGRGRVLLGQSERQWAVRGTCRDWDPAGWCRRPRVAVRSNSRWVRLPKPAPPSVPSPRQSDQTCRPCLTRAVSGL